MTATLPFTGERFTPEVKGAIWYEHWHRYSAILSAVRGRRVLDAACGEGYGSWLLAGAAAEVVGIDVDAAAIRHAVARYAARNNLRYMQASCAALPLATDSVDLIVSFETIEHLECQEAMLAEFRRVLAPTGALVISSPNKVIYSDETGFVNEFHVRELTRDELAAKLEAHFPQQTWFGQRVLAHSLMWKEEASTPRTTELVALADDCVHELSAPAPPMYFVVVCGANEATLPSLAGISIFDDGAQSLYRDYERALLTEKRLYWDEIDARKIADARLADLVTAASELGKVRRLALERETELLRAHSAREEALAKMTGELEHTRNRLAFRETWRGWLRWPLGLAKQRLGK